jgi:hypothetical protein
MVIFAKGFDMAPGEIAALRANMKGAFRGQ